MNDDSKKKKECILLQLRMVFNKKLLEKEIISFDIYHQMQVYLSKKMNYKNN